MTVQTMPNRALSIGPGHRHRPGWEPMRVGARGNPLEPWGVVQRRRTGRLRYPRARGLMALPVRYAPWDHRLYLRLPDYSEACHFLDGSEVALDVDLAGPGQFATVRFTGPGLVVPEMVVPPEAESMLERWPSCVATVTAMIALGSIGYLPVVDDARFPPIPAAADRDPAGAPAAVGPGSSQVSARRRAARPRPVAELGLPSVRETRMVTYARRAS